MEGTMNFATLGESVWKSSGFSMIMLTQCSTEFCGYLETDLSTHLWSSVCPVKIPMWAHAQMTSFISFQALWQKLILSLHLSLHSVYQACSHFRACACDALLPTRNASQLQGTLLCCLWLFCSNFSCINFERRKGFGVRSRFKSWDGCWPAMWHQAGHLKSLICSFLLCQRRLRIPAIFVT